MPKYKSDWPTRWNKVLILHVEGYTQDQIAEKLGLTSRGVRKIMSKAIFYEKKKAYFEVVIEEAKKRFGEHVVEAIGKIVKTMRKGRPSERIQFDAAKEILYQAGIKPIDVIETRQRESSPEELASSAAAAKEVEEIVSRLTKTKSRFVLSDEEKPEKEPDTSTNEENG